MKIISLVEDFSRNISVKVLERYFFEHFPIFSLLFAIATNKIDRFAQIPRLVEANTTNICAKFKLQTLNRFGRVDF